MTKINQLNYKEYFSYYSLLVTLFIIPYIIVGQTPKVPKYTNCPTSEKYAYVWYFGDNAGLDFNYYEDFHPSIIEGLTNVNQFEGSANICDSLGNLQFYTTGYKTALVNANYNYLEDGLNMSGNYSSTQSSIIIPIPENPELYYLFSINIPYFDDGLTYSLIDMSTNNGEGSVEKKDDLLRSKVCEKITAIKHQNNKDIWVITHEWGTNQYIAFLITKSGISDTVKTNIGIVHTADQYFNNAIGYLKASPNGNKLACAVYGLNTLEILDFDNETGVVSNPITSSPEFTGAYGIAFSPDGSKLYASTIDLMGSQTFVSRLMQFQINEDNAIFNNYEEIYTSTNGVYFCALQLAPDGKIYVAKSPLGNTHLDIIYNPNRPGTNCNYNHLNGLTMNGISLEGGLCKFGLPNFIQSYFDIQKFEIDSCCQKNWITFSLTNLANVDDVQWTIKKDNEEILTTNEFSPQLYIDQAGIYTVTCTDYYNGNAFKDQVQFEIYPEPEVYIGQDTTLLDRGETLTLTPGTHYQDYYWQDGNNRSFVNTSDTGIFWVEVTDYRCCKNVDSTHIIYIDMYVANAFTPNNDGVNDKIYIRGNFFREVDLKIFNRLGEMVFETNNQDIGWDGTHNGVDQDMGVFYFYFVGTLLDGKQVERKGNITLIR